MATEREMLSALLEDDRLGDGERGAFRDMSDGLEASPGKRLTEKQRKWVEGRFEELGLGSGDSLNLHSSGKVPKPLSSEPVLPWEKPGYVKPTKPPGR